MIPKKLVVYVVCAALVVVGTGQMVGPALARQGQPASGFSAHHLWTAAMSANADSVPAYVARVRLPGGSRRALLYVLAGNNTSNCDPGNAVPKATTYALDASTGKIIWSKSTSGRSQCTTAGPVADPSGKWIYSPGLDGKVHRYNAATGAETKTSGWPVTVTLMPDVEKTAANATIGNGRLYVTTSGFIGDGGHYQGHLVTIALPSGRTQVFNSLCSNIRQLLGPNSSSRNYCAAERSGLFGRGQGVVDPVSHAVYVVSGNGPWDGHRNWGDTVLKLDVAGARLLDAYTPTNQKDLENQDADLGSTGPAILPTIHQGRHAYHLLVQGGKGPACSSCRGVALRLLNRDNLSGRGGPGHLGGELQDIQAPGGCQILTAPLVWTSAGHDWVIYANACGLAGYRLSSPRPGTFRLQRVWFKSQKGTTPVLVDGIVYVATDSEIDAVDPGTGALLGKITQIGGIHWEYPLAIHQRVFMTDETGHVYGFAVGGGH